MAAAKPPELPEVVPGSVEKPQPLDPQLDPDFEAALEMSRAELRNKGYELKLNGPRSGFRTGQQQQSLIDEGYPAAPVGTSKHEFGRAADISLHPITPKLPRLSPTDDDANQILEKYGIQTGRDKLNPAHVQWGDETPPASGAAGAGEVPPDNLDPATEMLVQERIQERHRENLQQKAQADQLVQARIAQRTAEQAESQRRVAPEFKPPPPAASPARSFADALSTIGQANRAEVTGLAPGIPEATVAQAVGPDLPPPEVGPPGETPYQKLERSNDRGDWLKRARKRITDLQSQVKAGRQLEASGQLEGQPERQARLLDNENRLQQLTADYTRHLALYRADQKTWAQAPLHFYPALRYQEAVPPTPEEHALADIDQQVMRQSRFLRTLRSYQDTSDPSQQEAIQRETEKMDLLRQQQFHALILAAKNLDGRMLQMDGEGKALALQSHNLNLWADSEGISGSKNFKLAKQRLAELDIGARQYNQRLNALQRLARRTGELADIIKTGQPISTGLRYPGEAALPVEADPYSTPFTHFIGRIGDIQMPWGQRLRDFTPIPFSGTQFPQTLNIFRNAMMADGSYPLLPQLPGPTLADRARQVGEKNNLLALIKGLSGVGLSLKDDGHLQGQGKNWQQRARQNPLAMELMVQVPSLTPWQKQLLPVVNQQLAAEAKAFASANYLAHAGGDALFWYATHLGGTWISKLGGRVVTRVVASQLARGGLEDATTALARRAAPGQPFWAELAARRFAPLTLAEQFQHSAITALPTVASHVLGGIGAGLTGAAVAPGVQSLVTGQPFRFATAHDLVQGIRSGAIMGSLTGGIAGVKGILSDAMRIPGGRNNPAGPIWAGALSKAIGQTYEMTDRVRGGLAADLEEMANSPRWRKPWLRQQILDGLRNWSNRERLFAGQGHFEWSWEDAKKGRLATVGEVPQGGGPLRRVTRAVEFARGRGTAGGDLESNPPPPDGHGSPLATPDGGSRFTTPDGTHTDVRAVPVDVLQWLHGEGAEGLMGVTEPPAPPTVSPTHREVTLPPTEERGGLPLHPLVPPSIAAQAAQFAAAGLAQHQGWRAGTVALPEGNAEAFQKEWDAPGNPAKRHVDVLNAHAAKLEHRDPQQAELLRGAAQEMQQEFGRAFHAGLTGEEHQPVQPPPTISAWRFLDPEARAKLPEPVRRALIVLDINNSQRALDPGRSFSFNSKPGTTRLAGIADKLYQQADEHLANGAVMPDPHIVAAHLATQSGQITQGLLSRATGMGVSQAVNVLSDLVRQGFLTPADEQGIYHAAQTPEEAIAPGGIAPLGKEGHGLTAPPEGPQVAPPPPGGWKPHLPEPWKAPAKPVEELPEGIAPPTPEGGTPPPAAEGGPPVPAAPPVPVLPAPSAGAAPAPPELKGPEAALPPGEYRHGPTAGRVRLNLSPAGTASATILHRGNLRAKGPLPEIGTELPIANLADFAAHHTPVTGSTAPVGSALVGHVLGPVVQEMHAAGKLGGMFRKLAAGVEKAALPLAGSSRGPNSVLPEVRQALEEVVQAARKGVRLTEHLANREIDPNVVTLATVLESLRTDPAGQGKIEKLLTTIARKSGQMSSAPEFKGLMDKGTILRDALEALGIGEGMDRQRGVDQEREQKTTPQPYIQVGMSKVKRAGFKVVPQSKRPTPGPPVYKEPATPITPATEGYLLARLQYEIAKDAAGKLMGEVYSRYGTAVAEDVSDHIQHGTPLVGEAAHWVPNETIAELQHFFRSMEFQRRQAEGAILDHAVEQLGNRSFDGPLSPDQVIDVAFAVLRTVPLPRLRIASPRFKADLRDFAASYANLAYGAGPPGMPPAPGAETFKASTPQIVGLVNDLAGPAMQAMHRLMSLSDLRTHGPSPNARYHLLPVEGTDLMAMSNIPVPEVTMQWLRRTGSAWDHIWNQMIGALVPREMRATIGSTGFVMLESGGAGGMRQSIGAGTPKEQNALYISPFMPPWALLTYNIYYPGAAEQFYDAEGFDKSGPDYPWLIADAVASGMVHEVAHLWSSDEEEPHWDVMTGLFNQLGRKRYGQLVEAIHDVITGGRGGDSPASIAYQRAADAVETAWWSYHSPPVAAPVWFGTGARTGPLLGEDFPGGIWTEESRTTPTPGSNPPPSGQPGGSAGPPASGPFGPGGAGRQPLYPASGAAPGGAAGGPGGSAGPRRLPDPPGVADEYLIPPPGSARDAFYEGLRQGSAGPPLYEVMWGWIKAQMNQPESLPGHYAYLLRHGAKYADIFKLLRRQMDGPAIAWSEMHPRLSEVFKGVDLAPQAMKLAVAGAVNVRDLRGWVDREDAENGGIPIEDRRFPLGWDRLLLASAEKRMDALFQKHPEIEASLDRLDTLMRNLYYEERDLNREVFGIELPAPMEHYFPHVVWSHIDPEGLYLKGTGPSIKAPIGRERHQQRLQNAPYVTDPFQILPQHIAQVLYDINQLKVLKAAREFDATRTVTLSTLLGNDALLGDFLDRLGNQEVLRAETDPDQAHLLYKLGKLARAGSLPVGNAQMYVPMLSALGDYADRYELAAGANGRPDPAALPPAPPEDIREMVAHFGRWLLQREPGLAGRQQAAELFGGLKPFTDKAKAELGDRMLTAKDLLNQMGGKYVFYDPVGYAGRRFKRDLPAIQRQDIQGVDEAQAQAQALREMVARESGIQMILPVELAQALDTFHPQALPAVADTAIRVMRKALGFWKGYQLLSWAHFFAYNFRNQLGDVQGELWFNPTALLSPKTTVLVMQSVARAYGLRIPVVSPVLGAIAEGLGAKSGRVFQFDPQNNYWDGETLEWQRRIGGISSLAQAESAGVGPKHKELPGQVLEELKWKRLYQNAVFDDVWDLAKFLFSGQSSGARKWTDAREAVLRLVNYHSYLDTMRNDLLRGGLGVPHNFGVSRPAEVMNIGRDAWAQAQASRDPKDRLALMQDALRDRAVLLSQELMLDYGDPSRLGRVIARVIPFWNYSDRNYWRAVGGFRNIFSNPRYVAALPAPQGPDPQQSLMAALSAYPVEPSPPDFDQWSEPDQRRWWARQTQLYTAAVAQRVMEDQEFRDQFGYGPRGAKSKAFASGIYLWNALKFLTLGPGLLAGMMAWVTAQRADENLDEQDRQRVHFTLPVPGSNGSEVASISRFDLFENLTENFLLDDAWGVAAEIAHRTDTWSILAHHLRISKAFDDAWVRMVEARDRPELRQILRDRVSWSGFSDQLWKRITELYSARGPASRVDELAYGRSIWPDLRDPREIREWGLQVARMIGDERDYKDLLAAYNRVAAREMQGQIQHPGTPKNTRAQDILGTGKEFIRGVQGTGFDAVLDPGERDRLGAQFTRARKSPLQKESEWVMAHGGFHLVARGWGQLMDAHEWSLRYLKETVGETPERGGYSPRSNAFFNYRQALYGGEPDTALYYYLVYIGTHGATPDQAVAMVQKQAPLYRLEEEPKPKQVLTRSQDIREFPEEYEHPRLVGFIRQLTPWQVHRMIAAYDYYSRVFGLDRESTDPDYRNLPEPQRLLALHRDLKDRAKFHYTESVEAARTTPVVEHLQKQAEEEQTTAQGRAEERLQERRENVEEGPNSGQ